MTTEIKNSAYTTDESNDELTDLEHDMIEKALRNGYGGTTQVSDDVPQIAEKVCSENNLVAARTDDDGTTWRLYAVVGADVITSSKPMDDEQAELVMGNLVYGGKFVEPAIEVAYENNAEIDINPNW